MPTFSELPITPLLPQILEMVNGSAQSILQAEPGAGKSTQVPLALLKAGWLNKDRKNQKIILLEPRRLAVRALADYLASQLGESIGQRVGYQVRNDRKIGKHTQLEIMTEGVLIRRLQNDPELSGTALIIFDEFHERSLDTDLALALCLDSQAGLREDLKILVMSATLAASSLSQFLDSAPVIQCPGRTFPVSVTYLPGALPKPLNQLYGHHYYQLISQSLATALAAHEGDCLVFLPGQKEILQAIAHVSKQLNVTDLALLALYGGLTPEAQSKVLKKDSQGRRKIIFTTNIAETSLTIEGITVVIDSGLVRHAAYDASSGMTRMLTQTISKASAIQRSGRAGRLAAGYAYRLWTESDHVSRVDFNADAILTSDLTDLRLEVALWGVNEVDELRWLTPPPKSHYAIAQALLVELGFLTEKGRLTPLGEQASQLGLSARMTKMLLVAVKESDACLTLACDIAAILSERDILKRGAGIDLVDRVDALQAYRRHQQTKGATRFNVSTVNIAPLREAITNSQQWKKRVASLVPERDRHQTESLSTGQLVALAYPDRLAKRRAQNDSRYQLSNGKGCLLMTEERLNAEPWLVVPNLDGQRKEGKVFLAAPISLVDIEWLFASQIKIETCVYFDEKKQRVMGMRNERLGALILAQSMTSQLPAKAVQACIVKTLVDSGLKSLPWPKNNLAWLARMRWLGQYLTDYAGFTEEALLADFEHWCAPYLANLTQWSDLKKVDFHGLLLAKLTYAQQQKIDEYAPTHYVAPSGKRVAIQYKMGKQPRVAIKLQELFGELTSPSLAQGKETLTFELLSPAQRPIQITADLAHFWTHSYVELAKEMRGQYPKHRWPEKPLEEKAGRSLQKSRRRVQD